MVQGDVVQMAENGPGRFHKIADVVVTNPPFGTKSNEGIDIKFLEAAQESFYRYLCSHDPARRSARAMVREDFAHYGYRTTSATELLWRPL